MNRLFLTKIHAEKNMSLSGARIHLACVCVCAHVCVINFAATSSGHSFESRYGRLGAYGPIGAFLGGGGPRLFFCNTVSLWVRCHTHAISLTPIKHLAKHEYDERFRKLVSAAQEISIGLADLNSSCWSLSRSQRQSPHPYDTCNCIAETYKTKISHRHGT